MPSTSHTWAPSARATKYGVPPTERNERTGEFTPPGMTRWARAKSSSLRVEVAAAAVEAIVGERRRCRRPAGPARRAVSRRGGVRLAPAQPSCSAISRAR